MKNTYAQLMEATSFLRDRIGARVPRVGLILGSGLSDLADILSDTVAIDYADVPHFPPSTAPGHAGRLICGTHGDLTCIVMQGRLHLYEGYPAAHLALATRALISLGAETLIITNAAGGIRPEWEPGTLMLISDHISFLHDNPLRGTNDDRLGPRFPDMTRAYDAELRDIAKAAGRELNLSLEEGVYAAMPGPCFETPAEIRMLRTLGADACGMSTVPEVLVARHMGARVLGISCITNKAAGITGDPLTHEEVTTTVAKVRAQFHDLLGAILDALAQQAGPAPAGQAE